MQQWWCWWFLRTFKMLAPRIFVCINNSFEGTAKVSIYATTRHCCNWNFLTAYGSSPNQLFGFQSNQLRKRRCGWTWCLRLRRSPRSRHLQQGSCRSRKPPRNVSKLKSTADIPNCKDARNVCLAVFVYFNSANVQLVQPSVVFLSWWFYIWLRPLHRRRASKRYVSFSVKDKGTCHRHF